MLPEGTISASTAATDPDAAPDVASGGSVSTAEIARFSRMAERWWDPRGPMRPLHQMNPLRVGWTDARLSALRAQHPDRLADRPLRLLDLGCGAGLASEPLARLGHEVLGIDASAEAITAARAHAAGTATDRLSYRVASAETLVAEDARFDAVIALEVIEHVTDPAAFLRLLATLLAPGGIAVLSTLNRSLRSLLTAKVGAEYVLRVLPAGTHDWRRFVTPVELSNHANRAGLRLADIAGMVPSPSGRTGPWRISRNLAVNYIACLASA